MITIVTVGGWKYQGSIINMKLSPLGKLEWIQLKTKQGTVRVNQQYIVSILEHGSQKSGNKLA